MNEALTDYLLAEIKRLKNEVNLATIQNTHLTRWIYKILDGMSEADRAKSEEEYRVILKSF
jgi:hypothetical protein